MQVSSSQQQPLMNLILAFMEANNRAMAGGRSPALLSSLREVAPDHSTLSEPLPLFQLYAAVGDAVRWARSADNKIARVTGEENWWRDFDYGYLVPAIRFVRNAVEHDWSRAVAVPNEHPVGGSIEADELQRVVWAEIRSRRGGRREYQQHLAGQSLQVTLKELMVVYANAILDMDDRGFLW